MRVINNENVVSFLHSVNGRDWTLIRSYEVSGYNHNVGDGFISLRPAIFAAGQGKVTFRSMVYRAL
jgi:xylan 1,4-beta-xylosidase